MSTGQPNDTPPNAGINASGDDPAAGTSPEPAEIGAAALGKKRRRHKSIFRPVRDARNRKVRGLWLCAGRYWAQLRVELPDGRRAPRRVQLKGAATLEEAKAELSKLKQARAENRLVQVGRKPLLADFISAYLATPVRQQRRAATQAKDRRSLARFLAHAGNITIDRISRRHIVTFTDVRLRSGISPRSVNLDLISLRGLLKRARDEGLIADLPHMRGLAAPPSPRRPMIDPEQFCRLLDAAGRSGKNAVELCDFIRFLTFSGAREQEALRMRWADVDLRARRLVIGSDLQSKNHEPRTVEFNPQLGSLLDEMAGRRPPDSAFLFPSPQRGENDRPARTLRVGFNRARAAAGLAWVGFHDMRHLFASTCIMAGIDFMTVAAWLGHKDGGILVGKVYGHLLDAHRRAAAARLHFGGIQPAEASAPHTG